jgi:putative methionine-R-sulfoxide reductase with GAF domain
VTADDYRGALEAVDRILNREPEADEVLRQAVAALHDRIGRYRWVGLWFVEGEELLLGPRAGAREGVPDRLALGSGDAGAVAVPVRYEGRQVGLLTIDPSDGAPPDPEERAFLERVALVVSAHCLVGWDTGGVGWDELQ